VSAWAKARRPAGPQPGVVAKSSSARVGVGEGLVACSSINFGRSGTTGQLSGIWLGLWGSASGGAAQSATMLIILPRYAKPLHATKSIFFDFRLGGIRGL